MENSEVMTSTQQLAYSYRLVKECAVEKYETS